MNISKRQFSTLLAASALLAMAATTTVEAASKSFKSGTLTLEFFPATFATILSRAGNAYNGVDSNGRPNEERWEFDKDNTDNLVFQDGRKGIIKNDAFTTRDMYLDDYFTSEEFEPLTANQVIGRAKRLGTATLAYNLIFYHNRNPLMTDDAVNLLGIHRLPFSEPWPKPEFKRHPHGVEPKKPANDNGGRNPQKTDAVFDDIDPMATFTGQIGVSGAFRMNGRWGQASVGDMVLRYDPLRPTVNGGNDRTTGLPLGGKPGTDGWYIFAHMNLTSDLGIPGVGAFETANTKVNVTGDTFVLTGNLVLSRFWNGSEGPNGIRKAGKFRFVGKLMPTPN